MLTKDRKFEIKVSISLLMLTAILITPALHAGDEDMSPNAYHIFDPVTGYMVTVEPQTTPQQGPEASAADGNMAAEPVDDQAVAQPQTWLFMLAVMLLAGGYGAWKRNKDNIRN